MRNGCRTAKAVEPFGLGYRHVAGVDMLVEAGEPSARREVRLILIGEELGPRRTIKGIRLVPLADLVRMKLTSFRAKDEAHAKDLDEAGLITPEIEAGLSKTGSGAASRACKMSSCHPDVFARLRCLQPR